MKIAYFYRLDKFETHKRFVEEGLKLGIEIVPIKYRQLSLQDTEIYFGDMKLSDFDLFYFRAVGSELEWSKLLDLYARKHKIPMVDEYLGTEGPLRRFKAVMGWQLIEKGVSYPKTVLVEKLADLVSELDNWELPVVVKLSKGGRHGMGTFWIRRREDLDELAEKLEERKRMAIEKGREAPVFRGFLIQPYIPNDGDYRVFVVGYKVVAGFKRQAKEEKLVMNKSVGRSEGLKEVPSEVVEVAEAAARAVEVEVAGIDLVKDSRDGKVYVVEVNEAPEFRVMEKRTGKNIVKMIVEYLAGKAER